MDDVAIYNRERWQALARANAVFTRAYLDLDTDSARAYLDPEGRLGDVAGKDVLCLAAGGGQQSVAFALLGAHVTVVDISEAQLQRDQAAAAHYHLKLDLIQGDMRDLARFGEDSFDIVWHPYSLNFVPDARVVFHEVARVLRSGGIYHVMCANPFFMGLSRKDWDGAGYALQLPYIDGAEITYEDERWIYKGEQPAHAIKPPKEYRHTLDMLINGLIAQGFLILNVAEQHFGTPNATAEPGTPEHFTSVAPPWLTLWAAYRPDVLGSEGCAMEQE
ncbi:MAG TPA: class I SAM-dependent methyltransferase [Roseiflexaceae bacterium]|nr:class I SAM-dependent methyltransferase [Roseiflexaceae bacterium]